MTTDNINSQYKPGEMIALTIGQILVSKDNPRKDREKSADPHLVASIRSRGLLQNLGVTPSQTSKNKFEVKYGSRRFAALKALLSEGHFKPDDTFPCRITGEETKDYREEQLAENVARKAMNPIDEYEAFVKLKDDGLTIEEIAERFGADIRAVKQRLALGQAAPCVRKALREGEITLEVARVYAGCPDTKRQQRVFKEVGAQAPHTIKRLLYECALAENDNLVRFVGIEHYQARGGAIEEDLFSGVKRLVDVELIHDMRDELIAKKASELIEEGWSWAEALPDYSYNMTDRYSRVYGSPTPKTEEEQNEIDKIIAELEAIEDHQPEHWDDEKYDQYEALEDKLYALKKETLVFEADKKAFAGCIVTHRNGEIYVDEGLIRPEDKKKVSKENKEKTSDAMADDTPSSPYGKGLVEDLETIKALSLRAAILTKPEIAVTALKFLHVYRVLNDSHEYWSSGSTINGRKEYLKVVHGDLDATMAALQIEGYAKTLRFDAIKKDNFIESWKAFSSLTLQEQDALAAFAFIHTIEPSRNENSFASLIGFQLGYDASQYWRPCAAGFFNRLKKAQLIEFLDETMGAHDAANLSKDGKMKKGELVDLCDSLMKGETPTRPEQRLALDKWVPETLSFVEPTPSKVYDWDKEDEDDEEIEY